MRINKLCFFLKSMHSKIKNFTLILKLFKFIKYFFIKINFNCYSLLYMKIILKRHKIAVLIKLYFILGSKNKKL